MSDKKDVRTFTFEQIQTFCLENNLPKFRAKQLQEWLWKKRATSFNDMPSLSKEMRNLFVRVIR